MHLTDVGRKPKVLGDCKCGPAGGGREGDEADAQVLRALELARLKYVCADRLDVLRSRRDVRALAACAVLHENKVPNGGWGISDAMTHSVLAADISDAVEASAYSLLSALDHRRW